MQRRHTIQKGTDAPITVVVTDRGVAFTNAQMAAITRWVFTVNGETVDSDDVPTLFSADTVDGTGEVTIRPGSQLTVSGTGQAGLTFFDAGNPNGVPVFGACHRHRLLLTVC